ncbi:hypothetical protein NQD34_004190 [Periophthalmus magnuspinnatus]|nr:hypothetical protein NQD34_004190 [Periophthalmus magnuspinnatus]
MSEKRSLEGQVYSVPLIQPDVRREEAILQIADALVYLETISTDIFQRVSESVEKNRQQLQSVTDRIGLAQARVDKIKGSKKATKVQLYTLHYYTCTLHLCTMPAQLPNTPLQIDWPITPPSSVERQTPPHSLAHGHRIQSKIRPFDEKALQERLMYFPVCVNNKKRSEDETEEGLGSLPRNISSVSSLLLFNTTENLYKKYVLLDPLAGAVTKTHTALETEKEEKPFDAPLSITKREQLERQAAESYFYVPNLGQVPELVVPMYLPDLPGIADDLSYSADLGPGFAPSGNTHNIPELPSFSVDSDLPAERPSPSSPPPPEPASTPVVPVGAPPSSPPPPPPPADTPTETSRSPPSGPVSGAPSEVVQPSDGRASLLESIRNAGGIGKAKLRNVKERKMEKKKQKEQEQAVGSAITGGDFMSDLFNKLAMRRKGISGKGPAGGEGGDAPGGSGGAFARMSDVIPPPPAPHTTTGDDEDWEA